MTYSNILSEIYFRTKTNSTSFPIADITLLANNAMERVVSLIIQADGRWQMDDSNQTDLPIATTALVSGQADYSIAVTHLNITRVEFLPNGSSTWIQLEPIDQDENPTIDYQSVTGNPYYYDKLGDSFILYPKPNYSQAASLKVYFTRPPVAFTVSDTTATPGFNQLYHDLIPLWVSYEYCLANGLDSGARYFDEIQRKEAQLVKDYGKRQKDERPVLTTKEIIYY